MSAISNKVFSTALELVRKKENEVIPEEVLYGYTKLLLMDSGGHVLLDNASDSIAELEDVRQWFGDKKMELKLMKDGLVLLIPEISLDAPNSLRISEFQNYLLDEADSNTTSKAILEKAIELSMIPFEAIFSEGNTMENIYEYRVVLQVTNSITSRNSEELENIKKGFAKKDEGDKETNSEGADSETNHASGKEDIKLLSKKYRELNVALLDKVKGQDYAVHKFVQGINQGELLARSKRKKGPKTYFFFFGPPGVGKTFLAETAAESLGMPYMIFNMSEYADDQSYITLVGTDSQFKSSTQGSLTEFVSRNPRCLLVFDEIEKAHITTIRLFLQVLSSGVLKDAHTSVDVSFRDTIIIFTSNVGKEFYEDRSVNYSTLPEKVIVDAIKRDKTPNGNTSFPPEICSRIAAGNTVMFNHLSVCHLVEIVKNNFEMVVEGIKNEYDINMTYSKYLPMLFLYNQSGEIDARVAVGQSERFLKNEIYEFLRQLENSSEKENIIQEIDISIDWSGMDRELNKLFKNEEKLEVLVFSDNRVFDSFSDDLHIIHRASSLNEAEDFMKRDIGVVYIDPFLGKSHQEETVLSVSDYNTEGICFFHDLVEKGIKVPIYMLENERAFSEVDKNTFLQEGAAGTVLVEANQVDGVKQQIVQISEEIYMERQHQNFCQSGWVVDYYTKQEFKDGKAKIIFYGLKKRLAVDTESKGFVLSDSERPNVSLEDVVGAENAKEEIKYYIQYLKNPKKFLLSGGKAPKGVLLYGPPGTGKTMLAKAMAGESDVTFLQTSASEFKNKYVGESEANIRRIFQKARKYAPAIIFIDEIDAIGKKRTGSEFTATTESMLNALLTEMDGFSSSMDNTKPVFVLAATNFGVGAESDGISSLDSALIRRFDNKIYVDLPNESERKLYVVRSLEKKKIEGISDETVQNIAERTTGQSLAILQNVIDLAFRNAQKQSSKCKDDDLLTALEEYLYGEKREHSPEYYRKVAYHEVGHAYVSYISGDVPSYITIESRGNFGGYMQHSNQEDVSEYTKEQLLSKIRTALAGRAAEEVFFGKDKSLNTGASSDLHHATEYAFRIICSYGMMENQLIVLARDEIMKSSLAAEYVSKINNLLSSEMENTVKIIEGSKKKIEKIVCELVKKNRLTGEQFKALMEE